MLKQLPNALTILRLVLAPVIGWLIWLAFALPAQSEGAQDWALWAAVLFVFAGFTDLLDGALARLLKADSKLGRILDPIADKALVALPLIAMSVVASQIGQALWLLIAVPAGVIVLRDIIITIWRLTAPDGEGAPVSRLAKWKTAIELVAVGLPILMIAMPALIRVTGFARGFSVSPAMMFMWIALLFLAATLSVITALQYVFALKPDDDEGAEEDAAWGSAGAEPAAPEAAPEPSPTEERAEAV
jgi:cardiolipin synthase (CMP-forming)